jgi:short-subunit dehydrogenase
MGEVPVPGLATYNASKAGIVMFSDAARLEFRKSGIKISVILPGAVNTELAAGIKGPRGIKNIEPEDVATAVIQTLEGGRSRPRVYVPRSFGMLLRAQRFLPRVVGEATTRELGAESAVLEQSDLASRAAYQQRIERS